MLRTRVLTAATLSPLLIWLICRGGLHLAVTCVLLCTVMAAEVVQMALPGGHLALKVGACVGCALQALCTLGLVPAPWAPLCPTLFLGFFFLCTLGQPQPLAGALTRIAIAELAVIYCGTLLPYLALLRQRGGASMCLVALGCTWAADTGAYFAGRAFGRHKLLQTISPNKTLEGALGGLICAAACCLICVKWLALPIGLGHAGLLGALTAVFGLLGDLCESMLKRSAGVKDSSQILPGHGGMLDRFDAVLFAVPAFYGYLLLF